MKFTYQLSIAFMMILLFVSGLSIVRSEEAPDSVTVKKGFKEAILKNMNVQKIEAASTCSPPPSSSQIIGSTSYICYDLSACDNLICTAYADSSLSCCYQYTNLAITASDLCALDTIGCNSWSSPTGLFSLTYTNNNGKASESFVISDSLANQLISNPSLSLSSYINTEDFYICTGTYNAATDDIVSTTGGCDLSKKSVNSGETYYFVTDSANYSWSISYPLGSGAIAGIVIGVLVFLGCCCGLIFVIMNNNKKKAPPQPQTTIVQLGPGQASQNPTVVTTNVV